MRKSFIYILKQIKSSNNDEHFKSCERMIELFEHTHGHTQYSERLVTKLKEKRESKELKSVA